MTICPQWMGVEDAFLFQMPFEVKEIDPSFSGLKKLLVNLKIRYFTVRGSSTYWRSGMATWEEVDEAEAQGTATGGKAVPARTGRGRTS